MEPQTNEEQIQPQKKETECDKIERCTHIDKKKKDTIDEVCNKILDMIQAEGDKVGWNPTFYRIMYLINTNSEFLGNKREFHPNEWERLCIKWLRRAGFKFEEIGYVFERSKETIFNICEEPLTGLEQKIWDDDVALAKANREQKQPTKDLEQKQTVEQS